MKKATMKLVNKFYKLTSKLHIKNNWKSMYMHIDGKTSKIYEAPNRIMYDFIDSTYSIDINGHHPVTVEVIEKRHTVVLKWVVRVDSHITVGITLILDGKGNVITKIHPEEYGIMVSYLHDENSIEDDKAFIVDNVIDRFFNTHFGDIVKSLEKKGGK